MVMETDLVMDHIWLSALFPKCLHSLKGPGTSGGPCGGKREIAPSLRELPWALPQRWRDMLAQAGVAADRQDSGLREHPEAQAKPCGAGGQH